MMALIMTTVRYRWPATFSVGLAILSVNILLAILGPLIMRYGYAEINVGRPLEGVSWQHPFNVDQLGRDVFSRALYGGRLVILLSLLGTMLGFVTGCAAGLISGLVGGFIDSIVMRFCEVLISIPFLILALLVIMIAGPEISGNPAMLIFVIGLVYFPRIARIARVAAVEVATRDYVTAARLRSESMWMIIRYEILPNVRGTLLVEFAIRAGYAPVLVGALGFLGFGVRPPLPEWGLMMSEYRNLLVVAPATVLGPGIMLASLVIGLNLFTDGLARIGGKRMLGHA